MYCVKVDAAIDACSKMVNIRQAILECKQRFDQYVASGNNQVSAAATQRGCTGTVLVLLILYCKVKVKVNVDLYSALS